MMVNLQTVIDILSVVIIIIEENNGKYLLIINYDLFIHLLVIF